MQSKKSCFNPTLFKKNLTRFAPVTVLYTLCLILCLVILYTDTTAYTKTFWFASRMCEFLQIMSLVNLCFAPLVAILLFGDLFTPRMCNALHALPLRRESFFLTNVLSGLVFSLVSTAVMALLSLPLLAGTCVQNAWQIGILWFLGANLEFVCFFGIAVFCVFCTGNRFAMALVYAAINGGAFGIRLVVNSLYTPMLYGVITPSALVYRLTPIFPALDGSFLEVQNYNEVMRIAQGVASEMTARFWVNPSYGSLAVSAAVGAAFLAAGLLLYRRRDLECAGDAIAIPALRPLFQVVCAIGAAVLGNLILNNFFGYHYRNITVLKYLLLGFGLVVGWFAGKMLLERSTRVFGLKNWTGLGILALATGLSLVATHFDILGIETWVPQAEDVRSVTLYADLYAEVELTEAEDIRQIIRLQEMALEDRVLEGGSYPLSYVQSLGPDSDGVPYPQGGFDYDDYDPNEETLYAGEVYISYHMKNGRTVRRIYCVWLNQEEGDLLHPYRNRWDVIWKEARAGYQDPFDWDNITGIAANRVELLQGQFTAEEVQALHDALLADCEAGTMAQEFYYHDGYFRSLENPEDIRDCFTLSLTSGDRWSKTGANINIYPDAQNTLNWLRAHGLLNYEILPGSPSRG